MSKKNKKESIEQIEFENNVGQITQSIIALADLGKIIEKSRLKHRMICLLLHATTKVPVRHIKVILAALPTLEKDWLKPKKP